jgi:arabinogalactan oligomer/maltooligosaccharide transport system substrate-binding protein
MRICPLRPRRPALLAAAAALALAAGPLGCAQTSNEHTLTLWHAWGGAELATLKTLIGQFQAQHPGLEVMPLQVPYDKLKDKYLRSAAANGGPDLVIGDADWSGKFAASDLVLRTDELFSKEELARFNPGALASLTLGGKLYAVPESRETIALYYNKKLLPQPPKTIGEVFAKAPAIPGVQYGLVYNAKFYYAMGYFFASGGRLFDAQGLPAVDSPAAQSAFGLFEKLSKAKGILTSPEYNKGDSLYKEGQTAMIVNGPWALVDYQKKLGKDLGVATLPTLDDGKPAASWVGVKCMMFNPNADDAHRKLAKDFALFLTTPESQKLLSEQAGHIPAVRNVKLDPASPLAVFQAQADVGTPVSIQPEVSLVWEPMDKAVRQVTEHESPPAKALSEAETVIKAKLDAMRAQSK